MLDLHNQPLSRITWLVESEGSFLSYGYTFLWSKSRSMHAWMDGHTVMHVWGMKSVFFTNSKACCVSNTLLLTERVKYVKAWKCWYEHKEKWKKTNMLTFIHVIMICTLRYHYLWSKEKGFENLNFI